MIDALAPFLDAALRMPTAVFTWMLIPVGLYWVVSLSGVFSLDWIDGVDGAIDGASEGLAEAAGEALAESAGEALAESAGEALAESAGEALAESAGEMLVESAGEAAHEAAGEVMIDTLDMHQRPSFLEHLSFGDVPRSFSWSLVIGFAWLFSLLGSVYIPGFDAVASSGLATGGVIAAVLGVVSLGLGVVATSLALRPVNKAMRAGIGARRHELVGRTCTIRTSRVDATFGQAEVDDGAMIIDVRTLDSNTDSNPDSTATLGHGSRALIYNYDGDREVFLVAPLDRELAP
ncbi:MAG: hypothetical protein AAGE94_11560 [Acidobacteriota bacterium]